jgi:hypothetical protein
VDQHRTFAVMRFTVGILLQFRLDPGDRIQRACGTTRKRSQSSRIVPWMLDVETLLIV